MSSSKKVVNPYHRKSKSRPKPRVRLCLHGKVTSHWYNDGLTGLLGSGWCPGP